MQSIKRFVTPNWKKAILFVIFVLIMLAGLIVPFIIESPAQSGTFHLLTGNFFFTPISRLLSFPYLIPLRGLEEAGLITFPDLSYWLFIVGDAIYLYFLSCLLVSGYNRYTHRFSVWHWIVILGISFILCFITPVFYLQIRLFINRAYDILNYLGISLTATLYLYLFICLGFFVHDVITKRRVGFAI